MHRRTLSSSGMGMAATGDMFFKGQPQMRFD
jgi:hypothetical protein